MTSFEKKYMVANAFLPVLYREVRKRIMSAVLAYEHEPEVLDVGGRKSHYTIGVPARITISDLPRQTSVQHQLNLGLNEGMMQQLRGRRSNVSKVVFDDMTNSHLGDCLFEVVVSVEVLEHVTEDAAFVQNVYRVLKSGGCFIMTTPNGDYIRNNTNPDHKRHYTRDQLRTLLQSYFQDVEVVYAVRSGRAYSMGLKSWSMRHPARTLLSMIGNVVNCWQSSPPSVRRQALRTQHLVVTARKA